MQVLKKTLVRLSYVSASAVLALTVGAKLATADAISDVLTVSDTMGFSMNKQLLESQEPGRVSIGFPGRVLDLTDRGGTQLSDILTMVVSQIAVRSYAGLRQLSGITLQSRTYAR